MTKHAAELQRRLASDDPTTNIIEWYLQTMAAEEEIFAEVEMKFIADIIDLYLLGKKYGRHSRGLSHEQVRRRAAAAADER